MKMKKNWKIMTIMASVLTSFMGSSITGVAIVNAEYLNQFNRETIKEENINEIEKNIEVKKLDREEREILDLIMPVFEMEPKNLEIIADDKQLDSFISDVKGNMEKEVEKYSNDIIEEVRGYGINDTDTVEDIREKAEVGLRNIDSNIEIDSPEFEKIVHKYIDSDEYPVERMAQEDPDFGALYIYMCIYDTYIINDDKSTVVDYGTYSSLDDIESLRISEIAENDGMESYINVDVPQLVKAYTSTKSTAWPKLNGNKIHSYARTYALNNNPSYVTQTADCTNFVSQALFYGGLKKTFYTSEKNKNGVVETDKRWFYFNNNSRSKYAVSSSWIRVNELYNYLAPHYGVFTTQNKSKMNDYLQPGFVLQGKKAIGAFKHSVIVTKSGNEWKYCAHSYARKNAPLKQFYDAYKTVRVIQTF